MAIDYDSGAGLFDKLGKVVKVANLLETFETSTSAGNLEKEFQDLEAELEETKEFDQVAITRLYDNWKTIKQSIWSMKTRITALVHPFLQSEMVSQENLGKDDLAFLLEHLNFAMRRDSEDVDGEPFTVTFADGSPTPPSDILFQYVNMDGTNRDATAGYRIQTLKDNYYQVECVDETKGSEKFRLIGDIKPTGGLGDPTWQGQGDIGTFQLRNIDSTLNFIKNGGFETFIEGNYPTDWVTSFASINTLQHSGSRCLEFNANGTIKQTISKSKFKVGSAYVLLFFARKSVGADGVYSYNLYQGGTSYAAGGPTNVSTLSSASFGNPIALKFFVTERLLLDLVLTIEKSGATGGSMYVDTVALYEFDKTIDGLRMVFFQDVGTAPLLDEQYTLDVVRTLTSSTGARFAAFFARYFNFHIPNDISAVESISDALCT